MSEGTTLGKAWVQIVPSAKGISGSISNLLSSEAASAGISAGTSLGNSMVGAIKGVVAAAGIGAATASAAAAAFGADAVRVGQSFDKSMSNVAATMGFSVEELNQEGSEAAKTFKELRDFAQDMGAKTAFSASASADALNFMALAGYDAKTSMKMLPNVLNLAAAGDMELAAASDMVTDSQSALGLTLEETSALVDKMAKASSKSNTSVSQLGSAILTVGGTAKAMKGGTTELAQVLGIIADNGVKGAEGGTALRNIILSLTAPTDKAAATLERLGVSVMDNAGNMRSMKSIFADLNKSLGSMSEAQKTAVLSEIFNKVDLKSVNALMGTNVERWDELSEAIDNASGAAEEMANVQLDNLAGDITIFQSALEGVKIAVSDEITPALREFVQLGTKGLSDLAAAVKEKGLAGAMDALGPFIDDAIGLLMEGVPKAVAFGGQLLGAIASGIVNNLPKLAEGAAQVVVELSGQLTEAAPGIMRKGAELLAFFADGILNNIDSMVDAALNVMDGFAGFLGEAIPGVAEKGADIIIALAEALTDPDTLANLTESAFTIIESFATAIVENLPRLAEAAWDVIVNFATYLAENLPRILEAGFDFLIAFANGVMSKLPDFIARLPEIIRGFLGFVTDNLPLVLTKGAELLNSFIAGVLNAIPALTAALPDVVTAITDFLDDNFFLIVEKGVEIIKSLLAGIAEALPQLVGAAIDVLTMFGAYLWENREIIVEKALEIASELVGAVMGALDEIGNGLAEKIPALSLLFENLETVVTTVVVAFGAYKAAMAITGIIDGVSKAITGAKAAFLALHAVMMANPFVLVATLVAGVVAALITLWNTNEDFRNAVKEIWEAITGFFSAAWETIKQLWEPVAEYFGRIWEDIKTIFSVVEPVLKGFFSLAWEAVKFIWNAATGFFETLWHDIERVFSVVESVLGGFFSTAWAAIVLVWDAATGYFENLWNTIAGIFSAVERVLHGDFQSAYDAIQGVFSGWDDYFSGLWNDLTNVFSHAFDWFFDVGENIVKGITEGISEKWNGLLSFLGLKTDEIKEEFTGPQALDVNSPSGWSRKVFRNVMEGGEIGIEEGLPGILSGAESAVADIRDALTAEAPNVSGSWRLPDSYSYAAAPQLAAAGAGYANAAPQTETVIVEQPIQIKLNERILGEYMMRYMRTQQRARGR